MEDNESTIVAEPAVTYPMTSYAELMAYIHSVHITREDKEKVARRLTIEVTQPALAEAYERVDHLSMLRKDWDGYGALPISPKVLRNIKATLMISDNADWLHWSISPDSNATLGLQSTKHNTLISLGAQEFSYYAMIDGKEYGESHVSFSPEKLLSIMREFE